MTLGPNQRGLVRSTLMLLEQRLAEVDRLLDGTDEGTLYRRRRPALSAPQRRQVDALLAEIRWVIRSMSERHGLRLEEQDATRRIAGLMSISWQELGELTPGRLGAYGPVDARLEETFEPDREHLARLVATLETAVAAGSPRSSGDDAGFDPDGRPR